jgi:DNA mismatch repair protein MutS
MVETAYILQQASERSLIIMDEIGRGTSTYDGISIAWAIAEFLVSEQGRPKAAGPKTLFATHYHELQALADAWPTKITNMHMAMSQHHDQPVFLYQLTSGGASHSFGVAVAQLAGVPKPVIARAQTLLEQLELRATPAVSLPATTTTLDLPSTTIPSTPVSAEVKIFQQLQSLDINTLTPLEALTTLAEWRQMLLPQGQKRSAKPAHHRKSKTSGRAPTRAKK